MLDLEQHLKNLTDNQSFIKRIRVENYSYKQREYKEKVEKSSHKQEHTPSFKRLYANLRLTYWEINIFCTTDCLTRAAWTPDCKHVIVSGIKHSHVWFPFGITEKTQNP